MLSLEIKTWIKFCSVMFILPNVISEDQSLQVKNDFESSRTEFVIFFF